MTSEQIENLKGRLDERCVDGAGINVTREDVERLLDEREALLEALTGLEVWITKYVAIRYDTGRLEDARIPALATARRVLDKVCSP